MMCLLLHLGLQKVPTHPRTRQWWGLELSTILKSEYVRVRRLCGDYLDFALRLGPSVQSVDFMIVYNEANQMAVPATVKLRNKVHLHFPVPTITSERKKMYISKSAVLNAVVAGTLNGYARAVSGRIESVAGCRCNCLRHCKLSIT